MNAVNGISCYIDGTLESEGHIGSPEVIIDCLRKGYHVQPLLPEQVGRFVSAVAAQNHQAVQLQLFIGGLHGFHLIHAVFIHHPHQLERLAGGP